MDINYTFFGDNVCRPGRTVYECGENPLLDCLKCEGEDGVYKLRAVLRSGASLEQSFYGYSFLGAACCIGRCDIVEVIVDHLKQRQNVGGLKDSARRRSLLDDHDINGYTPLLYAVCGGHFDICRLLIEEGADPNLPHQMSRQTPLLMAIEHSQDEMVTYLLENNADVQISDNVGITPLYTAINCRNERVVRLLIGAECDVDIGSQDHTPIFLATRTGQLNIVKMLCDAGCRKNVSNKYGVTPVYEAALKGHEAVLEYLLEVECSPNIVDMYDQSPLHVAVMSGHLTCVKLLMEAGANWKLRNHNRESAFDLALQMGKSEIVQYFLEEGFDVLPKTSTPSGLKNIVAVFEQGHTATLSVLIKGCAKLPMLHCIGMLPMFRNQSHLMKLLLHSGIQTVPAILMASETHQCKETADWLKEFKNNPRRLQDICRIRIRRTLGNKVLFGVKQLPLPVDMKNFITLDRL
ncbi:ankyrin-3-like [Mercenaria mercenaria]|uniref:ankyrin-3-like n=1 Tax=Mercenaria mercenaria TaxID=6596 RepID=UPI00234F37E7|nr:ankyrin-3-like [Mercenaria mercenaria]